MNLYHYSEQPWIFDPTRTYRTDVDSMWFKPTGLWLSVDDDWKQWCRNNDFAHERLMYCSKVELASGSNVLHLEDEDDIDAFTRHYADVLHRNRMPGYINWAPVIKDYPGILIAPYCWERRMTPHTMWYYTWDCASACIWDLSVIRIAEAVDEFEARARKAEERAKRLYARLKRLEEQIEAFEGCWHKYANDAEIFSMIEKGEWRW